MDLNKIKLEKLDTLGQVLEIIELEDSMTTIY